MEKILISDDVYDRIKKLNYTVDDTLFIFENNIDSPYLMKVIHIILKHKLGVIEFDIIDNHKIDLILGLGRWSITIEEFKELLRNPPRIKYDEWIYDNFSDMNKFNPIQANDFAYPYIPTLAAIRRFKIRKLLESSCGE